MERYTFDYTLSSTVLHDNVTGKSVTLNGQADYDFDRAICASIGKESVRITNEALIQDTIKQFYDKYNKEV
jgi:hypothetical protein